METDIHDTGTTAEGARACGPRALEGPTSAYGGSLVALDADHVSKAVQGIATNPM